MRTGERSMDKIQLIDEQIHSFIAGDELDWLIFRYVDHPNEYDDEVKWSRRRNYNNDWKGYSTDIKMAWRVLEKLNLLEQYEFGKDFKGNYRFFWTEYENTNWFAEGDTMPLAICRAALKFVRDQQ